MALQLRGQAGTCSDWLVLAYGLQWPSLQPLFVIPLSHLQVASAAPEAAATTAAGGDAVPSSSAVQQAAPS